MVTQYTKTNVGPTTALTETRASVGLNTQQIRNYASSLNEASSTSKRQRLVWDTGWVNLYGAASSGDVPMSMVDGLDAGAFGNLTVKVKAPGLSGIILHLEHSMSLNGPWKDAIYNASGDAVGFEGTTNTQVVLSASGGDREFTRFLRWQLKQTDTPSEWQACFRLQAYVQA